MWRTTCPSLLAWDKPEGSLAALIYKQWNAPLVLWLRLVCRTVVTLLGDAAFVAIAATSEDAVLIIMLIEAVQPHHAVSRRRTYFLGFRLTPGRGMCGIGK